MNALSVPTTTGAHATSGCSKRLSQRRRGRHDRRRDQSNPRDLRLVAALLRVEALLRIALTDRTDEWTIKSVDERVSILLSMFTKEKP
jgi:hypothetical protein